VLRRLESLSRQVAVLYPAGPVICGHCVEQFTRLKDAATPIEATDLRIACHALAERANLHLAPPRKVGGIPMEDPLTGDAAARWAEALCDADLGAFPM
jgi:tRNA(fMet)-specific endonuclease VapC